MRGPLDEARLRQVYLSDTLKALRRRRGARICDLAQALGMPRRSYQHFEAGRSQINVERVHRVGQILDADPIAIFAAIELGSPDFAVRTADNKLMTILLLALKDFDAKAGDQIMQLDARVLMNTFEETFNDLAALAKDRCDAACRWRGPGNPRPGGR